MTLPSARFAVTTRCRELESRVRAGEAARAEDYLTPDLGPEDVLELVYTEFVCREELGSCPDPAEFFRRFPAIRADLEEQFLVHRALHDDLPPGGQAVGHYDLLREAGRGARGAVFEARDQRDGRAVAVKLLLSGEYATAEDRALFRHEAAVLARLDHPNLVRLYEAGVVDGRPYLALEFVTGPPLSRALADFQAPGSAAALVEAVARGVHHAHQQGVVHRDLKPANILIAIADPKADEEGATPGSPPSSFQPGVRNPQPAIPKVTDFGLARLLDETGGRTRTGDIVGTLGYMAPEQAAGTAHRAGPAADVYALGAILYELLTGGPPFGPEPTAATLHRLLHEPPPSPRRVSPSVPRDLETIALKCLEKRPDDRYPTALALADDLRRYLDGEPVEARPVGSAEAVRRWAVRRPTAAALVAVVVASLAGLLAGGVYHTTQLRASLGESERLRQETATANADLKTALAEADALRADTRRQLDDTRRVLFAHQLAQLPALWLREPVRARQLLANEKVCPPALRDFTWRHFRRLCSLDEEVHTAHPGGTRAVAFLPDGRLASVGADGKLRRWHAPGGPHRGAAGAAVVAHAGPVNGLAVLDARTVVTGGRDRAVKVWAEGGSSPRRTLAAPAAVNAVAADPVGGRVAAACDDGAVRVWELATGREAATLRASDGPVLAVAFGPGGKTLAAGGRNGTVRLWGLATGAAGAEWDAHEPVLGVAFAPGGEFVVSTGERGGVRVWDLKGSPPRELRGHLMPVRGAAVSPAGDRIATGGADTYLKVWDAATGQELTNLMRADVGAVAWSPDGMWVAGGGRDGGLAVYRLPSSPPAAAFSHPVNVGTLAARPGGGLVTADATGEVRVWDGAGGAPVARFAVRPHDAGPDRPLAVVGDGAPALAVSPDGRLLAVGAGGGELVLWDLARRAELGRLAGHGGNVAAVAFQPGGGLLATGGADGLVRLWDVSERQPVRTLKGHTRGVLAVAWAPDGRRLASGGEDQTVRLWDAGTGACGRTLTGHTLWVLGLAFRPDGKALASGSRDRTVRLWDLDDGKSVVLSGYTNWVYSVGFAPDGHTLATASGHHSIDGPGEVKLCDPDAGYVRAILTDVRAPAAFDPTGTRLFAGVRGGVTELTGR